MLSNLGAESFKNACSTTVSKLVFDTSATFAASIKDAKFVELVEKLDDTYIEMGKSTSSSNVGTGGMAAKLNAAKIATFSGADMVIANAEDVNVINDIIQGKNVGTLFLANKDESFDLVEEIR